ncbi:MAG: hypothetical protein ACTHK6_03620 [Solirubrobacterales bacterium]
MALRVISGLATEERFQVAFVLLAVSISVLIGVLTANVAWASISQLPFSLALGFCKYRHKRSLTR